MLNALDAIRMQMAVLALIFASWARFDNIVTIGQIRNIPTKAYVDVEPKSTSREVNILVII